MAGPRAAPLPEGVYLFSAVTDAVHHYLSFIEPDEVFRKGLAGEAIIGEVDATLSVSPAHFRGNSVFKAFLHEVIARVAPTLPESKQQARELQNGFLFVIDARVPDPTGEILPEDIMGAFRVADGEIVPDSYQINENHRLVSDKGLFRLHPAIHAELLRELREEQQ